MMESAGKKNGKKERKRKEISRVKKPNKERK